MAIQTGANATFYIATTSGAVPANQAAYEALTWVECEQTDALGTLGDTTADVNFTGLSDGRVQKLKGSSDAGTLDLSMAFNQDSLGSPLTGQGYLLVASNDTSSDNYFFKRVLGDATTGSPLGTGTTEYCSGLVGSFTIAVDSADSIVMLNSQIRVNSAIIRVSYT
jgi:hypothetical protein